MLPSDDDATRTARERMITVHLQSRDITNPAVIAAMSRVPRHELVAPAQRTVAYSDQPLPIGHGQTISQPYIVALMTQLARPKPRLHGAGCRYRLGIPGRRAGRTGRQGLQHRDRA